MKKILASTAVIGLLSTGMAFAQTAPKSLLDKLLEDADDIQVTLANISESLGETVDGSINITLGQGDIPTIDIGENITIIEGLKVTIGALETTAVGVLGDGTIGADLELSNIQEVSQAMTATSQALNLDFANARHNEGLAQLYNMSSNASLIDGSVIIDAVGVTVENLSSITTTAVGSLGTNVIETTISNNAAALTERLVGN